MRQWKLLILLLMIAVKPALAAEAGWGVWTDKEEKHTYAFLKNNEFRFLGERLSRDGVWQSSAGICWLGDKKRQTGNLMIYVDTIQCCMAAEFLANRLVLSEIWQKGFDVNLTGICVNRVLTKRKTIPGD